MSTFPNYQLINQREEKPGLWRQFVDTIKGMAGYLQNEGGKLVLVSICLLVNSAATILTPYFVARGIDVYIANHDMTGLAWMLLWLSIMYVISAASGYLQLQIMGHISQSVLFRLRTHVFGHIQSLPIAFFNQNKAGDLISRINNDTDKVNQFLSEFLIRFVSIFISLIGIGVFVFVLDARMAIVTLASTVLVLGGSRLISGWVQKSNKENLQAEGLLSAEVQENLNNFKVLVAFNRQDYFTERFRQVNQDTYRKGIRAQIASGIFNPMYNFAANVSQVAILAYGVLLIQQGQLTAGLLIGFLAYAQKFYEPLRIIGSMWGSFQSTMASWTRIKEILRLRSNLEVVK